jgi:hypothetical protein
MCIFSSISHLHLQQNSLVEDEAAEEEEEGAQAGLGDFGFGVTSNIREHDEEVVSSECGGALLCRLCQIIPTVLLPSLLNLHAWCNENQRSLAGEHLYCV